jgi:hypothetical protein
MEKFYYSKFKSQKSQSAMEYLMTYGWAILIIAIVLVALFSLGIFNSANFAPRAQPGSCEVLRNPAETSLAGQCNGELPQYVAEFNGASSYIYANSSNLNGGMSQLTLAAWVKPNNFYSYMNIIHDESAYILNLDSNNIILFSIANLGGSWSYSLYATAPQQINLGTWYFVSATWNGNEMYTYLNGQESGSTSTSSNSINVVSGPTDIGVWGTWNLCQACDVWNGSIANVQIYNTSLSANDIQALYQEGIGGAPINVNNLVGWWPLNGNANDYSGNGNSGTATGITYTSAWTSGYSAP